MHIGRRYQEKDKLNQNFESNMASIHITYNILVSTQSSSKNKKETDSKTEKTKTTKKNPDSKTTNNSSDNNSSNQKETAPKSWLKIESTNPKSLTGICFS